MAMEPRETHGDPILGPYQRLPHPSSGPELNKLGLNQPGTDSGTVSSYSALEIQSDSPNIVLSNGSLVTFNTTGAPVITTDDVISKAGPCLILYNRTQLQWFE